MSQGGSEDKQALEITIGEKFTRGTHKTKSLYSFARIYKVPEDLRKLNESAYVPRLFAVGPLHREDKHLQKAMQDVKMDYANHLFLRLGVERKAKVLQECVEKMKNCSVRAKKYYAEEEVTLVEKAKRYYGEELELNDDDMVEMMLVDGSFILELLYAYYHTNYCQASSSIPQPINEEESDSKSNITGCEQPRADPIFDNILTANIVKQDIILLENQIPFFVLEHLFQLTVHQIHKDQECPHKLSLEQYLVSYFSKFLSFEGGQYSGSKLKTCGLSGDHSIVSVSGCTDSSTKEIELVSTESGQADDYYHILHFIHSRYIPGDQEVINKLGGNNPTSTLHSELTLSASDLYYAGVEFVPNEELFEVKFVKEGIFCCGRTLQFQIPTIYIRNTTESFLRNVIALEQCCPGVPRYFTSYAKLMDMFINSKEDVQVLIKKKVIHNYLSTNEDVCDLFNKLCKEVALEDFHFSKECKKASDYNRHWRTRALRYVTRIFLASPWPALAFCLGIVTFGIAVYQFGHTFLHVRSVAARTAMNTVF